MTLSITFEPDGPESRQRAMHSHAAVHLLRWDDVFHEWDHEASFRLWWRAELAAKALTAANSADTYAVVDARHPAGQPSTAVYFYQNGREVDDQPEHTLPYKEA